MKAVIKIPALAEQSQAEQHFIPGVKEATESKGATLLI